MDATLPFVPYILSGLEVTLVASVATFVAASLIGLAAALWATDGSPAASRIVGAYVALFRSLPELLFIFIIYYGADIALRGLAARLGFGQPSISPFWAVTLALGIQFGAYCAEIFADARASLPHGQIEAGQALGLSPAKVLTRITIPLTVRTAIPGLGNLFLVVLKVSALASVIGLEEVTRRAKIVAGSTREPFASYAVAALCFLAVTAGASLVQSALERNLRVGGHP